MLSYADLLYNTAYSKTKDAHEAEDLVQETYLCALQAINKGKEIKNIKKYLLKVLTYNFYHSLRDKYNKPTLYKNVLENQATSCSMEDELNTTDTAQIVRRELAFLSKIYREVMVQYYMENKSVNEIAKNLNISPYTVKFRLVTGRKIVKEGVNSMESFGISSYKPSMISIYADGRSGVDGEPISVISNLIDQNALILAYSKPISVKELSEKMGTPLAFVEESVDKLVYHELMGKKGKSVFTNFLMIDDDMIEKTKIAQREFVEEIFHDVNDLILGLVKELKKTGILYNFNDTQLYSFAYMMSSIIENYNIVNKLELLREEDYPIRPNGGKWVIMAGYLIKNSAEQWSPTIGYSSDERGDTIKTWECKTSKMPHTNNRLLSANNLNVILYNLCKEIEMKPNLMSFIPDLIKYRLVKRNKDNKIELNIPVVTKTDYDMMLQLFSDYAIRYSKIAKEKIITLIQNNIVNHPKHINPVSRMPHTLCLSGLNDTFVYKAAEEGIIELKKNKNYPLAMIVEKG